MTILKAFPLIYLARDEAVWEARRRNRRPKVCELETTTFFGTRNEIDQERIAVVAS